MHVKNNCRWHNHLNPAINKEAWTQEEELALIRAHQIYGNKWAELTKFLPGRYLLIEESITLFICLLLNGSFYLILSLVPSI